MRSIFLSPYCPWPVNTGARVEMWKHLNILKEMGPCCVASAATQPVGAGWSQESSSFFSNNGFPVTLREQTEKRSIQQLWGILYAALATSLNMKRAFGHCNPYHRSAFSRAWWANVSNNKELAIINYSHWASLPTIGKKVVVLHDLFSDYMWGSPRKETEDLLTADLVVVISTDEEARLNKRGIRRTIWSPPCVPETIMPKSTNVGLIGSKNHFNIQGLKWLSRNANKIPYTIRIYGALGKKLEDARFHSVDVYDEWSQPYAECGIILMTTKSGMGLQIKGVEALACGRVIVARRGAMHGLPNDQEGAWIDVDTPEEMIEVVNRLRDDNTFYKSQSEKVRLYYRKYLDCRCIHDQLMESYAALTS